MVEREGARQRLFCRVCGGMSTHRRDNGYNGWTCVRCHNRCPDPDMPGCTLVAAALFVLAVFGLVSVLVFGR